MACDKISVIDFLTHDKETYTYTPEDTILDLKRTIAKEKGYEYGTKIQILWAIVPLENHELVKDYIDKEEGIFVHFEDYLVECEATGDTFVWLGKKKCIRLYAGVSELLKLPMNGNFAVMRSK